MLTERKKRFCDYYLVSLNATDAARKAGYTSKRPSALKQRACMLLKDPDISAYIERELKEKEKVLIVERDQVLEYLSGCVLGTQKEKQTFVLRNGDKSKYDDKLVSQEVDLKARDRIKAAEIMAKIYKLMDKNTNTEPQKLTIVNDIPKKEEGVNNE